MVIAGCLAGLGAAFLYLSGIEQWSCAQTAVPAMGFNGIAAAFLGGLNPIGSIFSAFFIQHYYKRRILCGQDGILCADLRSDLGNHHLLLRFCIIL
mgnify:CR=1 FL=1